MNMTLLEKRGELHCEELYNLLSSPNFIRMIVSRKVRGDGHKAHVDDLQWGVQFFFGKHGAKKPLVRPNFGARIILKWTETNKM